MKADRLKQNGKRAFRTRGSRCGRRRYRRYEDEDPAYRPTSQIRRTGQIQERYMRQMSTYTIVMVIYKKVHIFNLSFFLLQVTRQTSTFLSHHRITREPHVLLRRHPRCEALIFLNRRSRQNRPIDRSNQNPQRRV